MKNLKIAVIGAGSTYTPELVNGFLSRADCLNADSIFMMDIDERKNSIVSGLAQRMISAKGLKTRLVITNNLEEAIEGADYIMAQIRVGKLPARILDEKIPLKYDLLGQETTGVGGFFKALRTIPVMKKVAETMERTAKDAWLINFSNPSGIIAEMFAQTSDINYVGLCNAPINTERMLRKKLPDAKIFDYDFVGLNHFHWVTRVEADGIDVLPQLFKDEEFRKLNEKTYDEEFLRVIGGIPSGYLNYYYFRDETIKKCKEAEKSRGETCINIEEELLTMYQDTSLNEKPALLDKRGGAMYSEAAVSLVDAIENDKNSIHVVNTKHCGTIPFLDKNDIAEVKCIVGKDGPKPLPLLNENISEHIIGMIRVIKAYEKLTVTAGLTGDYETAFRALITHPLIGDYPKSKAVLDEMLEAHKQYLPAFFK